MDLKPGEALTIGNVRITLVAKSGQSSRIAIEADKSVPIARVEDPASPVAIAAGGIVRR